MEHRYATRFDVALNAWVGCPDWLTFLGNTRNISVDGSYIELTECRLSRTIVLEVIYSKDGKSQARNTALIAHASSEGINVRSIEQNPE